MSLELERKWESNLFSMLERLMLLYFKFFRIAPIGGRDNYYKAPIPMVS